jgi:hypothetical protein
MDKELFEKKLKEIVDEIVSMYPDDYETSQVIELMININKGKELEYDVHYELSRSTTSICEG